MRDYEQECLIRPAGIGVIITTKKDWSKIEFEAGSEMREQLSMTRGVYDENRNIVPEGEFRRRWLHTKLDEWINENLKAKK